MLGIAYLIYLALLDVLNQHTLFVSALLLHFFSLFSLFLYLPQLIDWRNKVQSWFYPNIIVCLLSFWFFLYQRLLTALLRVSFSWLLPFITYFHYWFFWFINKALKIHYPCPRMRQLIHFQKMRNSFFKTLVNKL